MTPGLKSSLKNRICDSGDDAKHEAIASFIHRYWLGTQMNAISPMVNMVTRKPKRNETEGEGEGNTKSNR
jgi:hypothetical protein